MKFTRRCFVTGYSPTPEKIYYDFVYLAHPRAVTGFSWRQTSKYMPKYVFFYHFKYLCIIN